MTTPFDIWWVGRFGRPPSGPEEVTRAGELRAAWNASKTEQVKILEGRIRVILTERDTAVGQAERHETLRRQAERQCDRIRKRLLAVSSFTNEERDTAPKATTMFDIAEEVVRARKKFPSREHLLAALGEEYGEVCRAYLENEGEERVYAEAMQVACVAIRIMEEGDSDFD